MKKFIKRLLITVGIFMLLTLVLYLARVPILRGVGNFLVSEDVSQQVDAAFILSGGTKERTRIVPEIYPLYAPVLITMGENKSRDLAVMGINISDAELSQNALLQLGIDSANIKVFRQGTSTYEESEEILGYSTAKGYKRVMIITSQFHTKRVQKVFADKFRKADIEVIVKGAPPLSYDLDFWWESEEGLIFVFNEYAKLIYYAWKY